MQRNCASGLQAIDSGMDSIRSGRADIVMVGGTEVMSRAPVLWNIAMINWLSRWYQIRSTGFHALKQYLFQLTQFKLSFLKPTFSLLKGLTDPLVGLSMGQTAENLASRFNISRTEMDQYALYSHKRLAQAISQGQLDKEIIPIFDNKLQYFDHDTGLRKDASLLKLAKLKPVFDKKTGSITAGNSAQVTDGATILLLASEEAIKKFNLPVLGKLIDCHWQGLAPEEMGLGPAHSIPPLLKKHQLNINDIDYWEINEAFAAQVLACQKALNDKAFCQDELGLSEPLGEIPFERLNIDGGGISLGHPVGASGSRIVLHLLNILKHHQKRSDKPNRGIASLCIGGGQGGAMLVESS